MIKYCPIMSFQKEHNYEENCMEEACAFWDEEKEQCCLKSAALAVAGRKSGGPGSIPLQAEYVYTSPSVHTPNDTGNWAKPTPYRIDYNTSPAPIPVTEGVGMF